MLKDFDLWNKLKAKLDSKPNLPSFKEREIWWCSLGINIGHEENGKNHLFNRPILVLRKFNKHIFLGIPLTTKIRNDKFYHNFYFNNNQSCAMLSQMRVWSSSRLNEKIGKVSQKELEIIKEKIKEMI